MSKKNPISKIVIRKNQHVLNRCVNICMVMCQALLLLTKMSSKIYVQDTQETEVLKLP